MFDTDETDVPGTDLPEHDQHVTSDHSDQVPVSAVSVVTMSTSPARLLVILFVFHVKIIIRNIYLQ